MVRKFLPYLSLLFSSLLFAQTSIKKVSGYVTDGTGPLENVSIQVKHTDKGVKTEKNGRYEIYVDEGQTLVYSYLGKRTTEIIIEDVTTFLNLTMYDEVEKLNEVVVTRRNKRTQKTLLDEYHTNKNLVKTAFGIVDKERSGFSMKVIDGDGLSYAGQDFIDALQSWVPGIQVFRPNTFRPGGGSLGRRSRTPTDLTIPMVFLPRSLRSMINPVPVTFDVDGVIYTDAPIFIPVQNIERIAVIESLGATNRYGNLGLGGVIIVNTKWSVPSRKEPGTNKPFDQVKLRDNFFDANTLDNWSQMPIPNYLESFYGAKTSREAESIFEELVNSYPQSAYFYLDAYAFFENNFDNRQLRQKIEGIIEDRFGTNPTILKALAYLMEEKGEFEKALEIYKKVFILRPHYVQSYMDLANAYQNLGKADNAATLYARYNYLIEKSLFSKSKTFTPIIHKDFRSVLRQNRNVLGSKYALENDNHEFRGTRIVFEWNDSEAEFELEFVDPNNQFFTTHHSLFHNPDRIREEKEQGFSSEEYLIYEPIAGEWSVNVKYLGNKSATPTFLKATLYHNFGQQELKKEIKLFKLTTKNAKLALFRIANGSHSATN
ncbi:carboxypeptidase-like regulatory domain-containing protein [Flagellimonas sp. 2504JD4-2]